MAGASTHPIQPNAVETTIASRLFKMSSLAILMLVRCRPLPRKT
jgi:hypothetical protein